MRTVNPAIKKARSLGLIASNSEIKIEIGMMFSANPFSVFASKKSILGIFWRLVLRHHQIKYGFQIYPETQIGEGFYLGHWGTVVINPKTKIGKNCNIAQGVNIAQANRGKNEGVPEIGNEVWIGPNAVIVGNIKIGNNVLIAPNSYLNTDVPSNSIVIGNPAEIISKNTATEGYINHKIDY